MPLEDELAENYQQLHETTGEPYDSIVRRVETVDPVAAAQLRKAHGVAGTKDEEKAAEKAADLDPSTPPGVDDQPEAPRGRRTARKSTAK